jgi:hypothetical protein
VRAVRTDDSAFEEEERVRVTDIDLALEKTEREYGILWRATVNEDEERAFAAEVLKQELEEAVDDERLRAAQGVSAPLAPRERGRRTS